MRENDENIRQFMPVLRRIIILVAVLTAIPVAMWTITAFVRTYIGPPKAPNYQPTVLTRSVTSDEAQAAPIESASTPAARDPNAPAPNVIVARATTTDADVNTPTGDPVAAPAVTGTAAIAPDASPAAPAMTATASATPAAAPATSQTPANATVVAAQQPAPQTAQTNWPAPQTTTDDALPAGAPIAGNVPLPRKRPHSFVVALSTIPLPRPRPDDAGPGAAAPSPTPLQWIHNIFQPSTGGAAPAAAPAAEDTNNYEQTPH